MDCKGSTSLKNPLLVWDSPVATGGFDGLSPPKQISKLPKLKYETL